MAKYNVSAVTLTAHTLDAKEIVFRGEALDLTLFSDLLTE